MRISDWSSDVCSSDLPYLLIEPPSPNVLGFYTLSNTSIQAAELPGALVKKLPRYPVLPATLLGRLAVDAKGRGRGLGTELLVNALRRCLRSETASLAVVRSEEHTSELQSLMRISYAVFCMKQKRKLNKATSR